MTDDYFENDQQLTPALEIVQEVQIAVAQQMTDDADRNSNWAMSPASNMTSR